MLFALMLPGRFFLLSIPLAVGRIRGTQPRERTQISALSLPITFLDVKTVIADPSVIVNAAGIRDDLYRIVVITFGVLAFALVASAFYKLAVTLFWTISRPCDHAAKAGRDLSSFVFNAVAFPSSLSLPRLPLVGMADSCMPMLPRRNELWQELWLPSSQVTMSQD